MASGTSVTDKHKGGLRTANGKGTSATRIYQGLRQLIVSFEIAPGETLEESLLARRFGGSRTPVREALTRLAGEGLVVLLANRHAKVAPMNLRDIKDHFEALDLLQSAVCHWAAVRRSNDELAEIERHCLVFEEAAGRRDPDEMIRANFDFHAAISTAAHNGAIDRAHQRTLIDQLRISRMAMTEDYFGTETAYWSHLDRIIREHREILQAITDGDAAQAEDAGRRHAGLGRVRISDYLASTMADKVSIPAAEPGQKVGKAYLRPIK
jgi:DNA-binding GntR family transcriptional regulator